MKAKHIVFLYSEMAGYFIACLRTLAPEVDSVTVYHWPINSEAPFVFDPIPGVTFIDRTGLDDTALQTEVSSKKPSVIVCSGWMDKGYVSVLGKLSKQVPTLCIIDTHWNGSLKQRLLCTLAKWRITDRFTHAWVAGAPQADYARRLGFKSSHIIDGYYSADVALFDKVYQSRKASLADSPKVFLFVGRYMAHKGIYEMWDAFIAANAQHNNEWQLWCLGAGEEYDKRISDEHIRHFGFVQPEEMAEITSKASVFILPSKFEPWGVVVHEFAVAGFPMLLNKSVGAATRFLSEGENGYSFDTSRPESIHSAFMQMMSTSAAQREKMSITSHEKGLQLTPEKWANELLALL